jgi:hypothetical protein
MLLVSSHILACGEIPLPEETVIRINMAWVPSLDHLRGQLDIISHPVWLDNPVGRQKPPANKYELSDLVEIMKDYPQVKYFAVSNVEGPGDLVEANRAVPDGVSIVPKIETIRGVELFSVMLNALGGDRVVMLDHDDLFADIVRNGGDPSDLYEKYVASLLNLCRGNNATLLRTQGVVFSDVS